jgi:protein ImuA
LAASSCDAAIGDLRPPYPGSAFDRDWIVPWNLVVASVVQPRFSSFTAEAPAARIGRLRQVLCAAEARFAGEDCAPIALGVPPIDTVLGGGLGGGALHEFAAIREPEIPAATGFVLALAARCNKSKSRSGQAAVWIAEDLSLAENGAPYGPGLCDAGIAPEHLITVAAAHRQDVLWTMEEALRCGAVGVVIGELRARDIDQVATRRLSLAAAAGNTLGLILRTTPDDTPSAAATRWIIGAAVSAPVRSVGPPRFRAQLVRNRRGHPGAWIVEWNSVEQRFELAANPEPVAGAVLDRSLRWRAKRAASAATQ